LTDILAQQVVTSNDAVESRVGDETVLLHLERSVYFGLDAMGTRIWAGIRQGLVPRAICAQLAEEFDVDPEVVEADARRFLTELLENDLIRAA